MKLALILLLWTTPAFAQHDYLGHSVLIGGNLLDLVSTRVALHNGAREVSPVGTGLRAQIITKCAFVSLIEGLSYAVARDGYPVMANRHRLLWGLGMIGVSLWNGHVISEQHRKHQARQL